MQVMCVNSTNVTLTEGKVYEVLKVTDASETNCGEEAYFVINDNGARTDYRASRFEEVEESTCCCDSCCVDQLENEPIRNTDFHVCSIKITNQQSLVDVLSAGLVAQDLIPENAEDLVVSLSNNQHGSQLTVEYKLRT